MRKMYIVKMCPACRKTIIGHFKLIHNRLLCTRITKYHKILVSLRFFVVFLKSFHDLFNVFEIELFRLRMNGDVEYHWFMDCFEVFIAHTTVDELRVAI